MERFVNKVGDLTASAGGDVLVLPVSSFPDTLLALGTVAQPHSAGQSDIRMDLTEARLRFVQEWKNRRSQQATMEDNKVSHDEQVRDSSAIRSETVVQEEPHLPSSSKQDSAETFVRPGGSSFRLKSATPEFPSHFFGTNKTDYHAAMLAKLEAMMEQELNDINRFLTAMTIVGSMLTIFLGWMIVQLFRKPVRSRKKPSEKSPGAPVSSVTVIKNSLWPHAATNGPDDELSPLSLDSVLAKSDHAVVGVPTATPPSSPAAPPAEEHGKEVTTSCTLSPCSELQLEWNLKRLARRENNRSISEGVASSSSDAGKGRVARRKRLLRPLDDNKQASRKVNFLPIVKSEDPSQTPGLDVNVKPPPANDAPELVPDLTGTPTSFIDDYWG
jgi:hypothetical protein